MKILIIDDHALFRAGLESLLKRREIDVHSCSNGYDGVKMAKQIDPDIVLVDLRMPDVNGIMTLKLLRGTYSKLPVVILTTSDSVTDLRECLENNASGYLLKDMNPDELVVALKKAIAGEVVVAPELAGKLAMIVQNRENGVDPVELSPFAQLTPRELEIMQHLTEGQSNKVIAKHVGISDGTVKLHVKSILKKLGLRSRVEAAVMAVSHNIFKQSK